MDPLRLLSRSTRLQKPAKNFAKVHAATPSEQRTAAQPSYPNPPSEDHGASRKRKRASVRAGLDEEGHESLNFFGDSRKQPKAVDKPPRFEDLDEERSGAAENGDAVAEELEDHDQEATRQLFKEHKLKATWINPSAAQEACSGKNSAKTKKKEQKQIYPRPLVRFQSLDKHYAVSARMQHNVCDQGYDVATEVQLAALPLLLEHPRNFLPESFSEDADAVDLLSVAPTGSGKTLAFLIPTFAKIARLRRIDQASAKHTTAIVLAPTKELVTQIVNEGRKLSANTGIKISQARRGMYLERSSQNGDASAKEAEDDAVKVNVLVSTPGTLHSIVESEKDEGVSVLPAVQMLVLDEADVLLDPLFREQTLGVWKSLIHPQLRVSLWSATMGSNIEELARSVLSERRERIVGTNEPETPLIRLVVGLKDSAVPNVQHRLVYAATEQGKLMGLRQLLHPATNSLDTGPTLRPPFLVFTQTIERAVALHSELLYDIPAEAGGISRIAVLHSDLSDTARDSVMTRFRKGEVWVLITTDLLSRGVDFRGVNGVVNYDIPTSSAAYVHRVGRTGRAGREGGVAVTLFSKDDIPYLKHIANIVAAVQKQRGASANGEGVQQWLLDALPSLSKNEKQKLKKHGVEARTARGAAKDPKGAKKARISTKSGYLRREENKRKGAILGSQRRARASPAPDAESEREFRGFD